MCVPSGVRSRLSSPSAVSTKKGPDNHSKNFGVGGFSASQDVAWPTHTSRPMVGVGSVVSVVQLGTVKNGRKPATLNKTHFKDGRDLYATECTLQIHSCLNLRRLHGSFQALTFNLHCVSGTWYLQQCRFYFSDSYESKSSIQIIY